MANPLLEKLVKNSTIKHTAILSESEIFNNKDVVTTDIPLFNIACSGDLRGGLSSGVTLLAGPTKVFKSALSLVFVRAYLEKYADAVAVIYDSEGGMTPDYLKAQGVDPERCILSPIEHLEMLKFDIVKQLKLINRGDHVIFVIDSVGKTASLKEIEDAENEKSIPDLQRAKVMKGLFRIITPSFVFKDIPCIAVMHTYETMGCLDGDTLVKTTKGTKLIKDISEGDEVFALSGIKKVDHKFFPEELDSIGKQFLQVEFDDGSIVKCTDNHKFLDEHGEWIEAKNFKLGQYL